MPEPPSLSVVVPIYNGVATVDLLVERLTAALRANGRPFEIILVNGGSHLDSGRRGRIGLVGLAPEVRRQGGAGGCIITGWFSGSTTRPPARRFGNGARGDLVAQQVHG